MDREKLTFALNALRSYNDIPVEEWDKASLYLKETVLEKNEYFVMQGTLPKQMAIIVSGVLRVFCLTDTGEEKTLSFRTKGQLVAAFSPFLENKESWYSIESLTRCSLLSFPLTVDGFNRFMAGHPCWRDLYRNYMVRLYIEKEDRERSFLMEDAKTRYLQFQKRYPELEKKIHQFHIASFLGISPVSLSRIRAALKKTLN